MYTAVYITLFGNINLIECIFINDDWNVFNVKKKIMENRIYNYDSHSKICYYKKIEIFGICTLM